MPSGSAIDDIEYLVEKSGHVKNYSWTLNQIRFIASACGYEILDKSVGGVKSPINMLCPKGHVCSISWNRFVVVGARCKKCFGKTFWTDLDVESYARERGYILTSGTYKNNKSIFGMICPKGHKTKTSWTNFVERGSCYKCGVESSRKKRRLKYSVIENILRKDGYVHASGEYTDLSTKITLMCPDGHKFIMNMRDFKGGNRCPRHKNSKGEVRIEKWLKHHDHLYEKEKTFSKCKDKKRLRFDFYIPSRNLAIEYNGRQHFEPIKFFGGEKRLKEQKKRDKIKKEFCKKNKIRLLEIPYWDLKNIDNLLEKEV